MRAYYIESEIISKTPLLLKFAYNNHFFDTEDYIELINDSTIVAYNMDKQSEKYLSTFSDTKLNRNKLLSYYIADSDLYFVNAYYELLKEELNGERRQAILKFLSDLRSRLCKQLR